MTNLNLFPMYSYAVKIAGVILSIVSLIAVVLAHQIDNSRLSSNALILLLFSLILVISSKEKKENEMIMQMRHNAIRIAFMMILSLMIAYSIIVVNFSIERSVLELVQISFISILLYLVVFYLQLITKFRIITDASLIDNTKKHAKFYLLYSLFVLMVCCVVFFVI